MQVLGLKSRTEPYWNIVSEKILIEKKYDRARFLVQKGPKKQIFEKNVFTLKHDYMNILCVKI